MFYHLPLHNQFGENYDNALFKYNILVDCRNANDYNKQLNLKTNVKV